MQSRCRLDTPYLLDHSSKTYSNEREIKKLPLSETNLFYIYEHCGRHITGTILDYMYYSPKRNYCRQSRSRKVTK